MANKYLTRSGKRSKTPLKPGTKFRINIDDHVSRLPKGTLVSAIRDDGSRMPEFKVVDYGRPGVPRLPSSYYGWHTGEFYCELDTLDEVGPEDTAVQANAEIQALKARVEALERSLVAQDIQEPEEPRELVLESQWGKEALGIEAWAEFGTPDFAGDLCITAVNRDQRAWTWIRKEQAREIIAHLERHFDL